MRLVLLLAFCGVLATGCGGGGTALKTQAPVRVGRLPRAEYGAPRDSFQGQRPRGIIMLIHGGGWEGHDPTQVAATENVASGYRAQGYGTVVPDYRAGRLSVSDVLRTYDALRHDVGKHVPICALGGSAGGHLALMLAERRPGVACVESLAGPTDLRSLAATFSTIPALFGSDLAAYSPVTHADRIKAKVLLIYAANDPIVPLAQGKAMKRALPAATLMVLRPGTAQFVHSQVDAAQAAQANRAELDFVNQATGG